MVLSAALPGSFVFFELKSPELLCTHIVTYFKGFYVKACALCLISLYIQIFAISEYKKNLLKKRRNLNLSEKMKLGQMYIQVVRYN